MQELTSLRYFLGIIDHGGFTAASRELHISQPTLTRSLQNLEFQLDCVLLKRDTGRLELTAEGELFAQRARLIIAEYASMVEDVRKLHSHHSMKVLVRGAPITAVSIMPEILARMRAEYPEVEVSLNGFDANYDDQRDAILAGDLDVALTVYDPNNVAAGLTQELLVEPEARLLVRKGHPAVGGSCRFSDLSQYTWVAPPGRLGKAIMEAEFRLRDLEMPAKRIQISDWRIAIDLLEETDNILVLPYHEALDDYLGDRFEMLPPTLQTKPLAIGIVSRPIGSRRSATKAFIEVARGWLAPASHEPED